MPSLVYSFSFLSLYDAFFSNIYFYFFQGGEGRMFNTWLANILNSYLGEVTIKHFEFVDKLCFRISRCACTLCLTDSHYVGTPNFRFFQYFPKSAVCNLKLHISFRGPNIIFFYARSKAGYCDDFENCQ